MPNWITSESPTIRPECELGLGCMYSSPPCPLLLGAPHISSLWNSEKPPRNNGLRGAPSRSSNLNGQGRPPLQGGRRIKRRIISCAQRGSRTYERTRTNQEVYYQPTGAKTQWHARVASAHTPSVTRMQIMVLRW